MIFVALENVIFAVFVDLPIVSPVIVFAIVMLLIGKVNALENKSEFGSIVTWPVVKREVAPPTENLSPRNSILLEWLAPPKVLVLLNEMASLPVPPPAAPEIVIAPEVLLPTLEPSIVTPSLLSEPLVPLVPVIEIAPPAE